MIDEAKKGSVFYRITISPDPRSEDTNKDLDFVQLTQAAVRSMREKLRTDFQFGGDIQFFTAIHGDQSDIRHVNAVLIISGRLTKEQFRALPKLLRQAAATDAKLQRELLDPEREPEAEPAWQQATRVTPWLSGQGEQTRGYRSVAHLKPTCPDCGPGERLWKLEEGTYLCPECGAVFSLSMGTALQREEEVQLSL
jgi:DNA-binding SARP family transcriptional activator